MVDTQLSEPRDTWDALVPDSIDGMYLVLSMAFVNAAYDVPVGDTELNTCGKPFDAYVHLITTGC